MQLELGRDRDGNKNRDMDGIFEKIGFGGWEGFIYRRMGLTRRRIPHVFPLQITGGFVCFVGVEYTCVCRRRQPFILASEGSRSVMSVDQSRLRSGPLVLTVLTEVPFDAFGIGVVWFRWMEGSIFAISGFRRDVWKTEKH